MVESSQSSSNNERMSKNLEIWADLTDLCLKFRLAMLRKQEGEHLTEADLFRRLRRYKEEKWRNKTSLREP